LRVRNVPHGRLYGVNKSRRRRICGVTVKMTRKKTHLSHQSPLQRLKIPPLRARKAARAAPPAVPAAIVAVVVTAAEATKTCRWETASLQPTKVGARTTQAKSAACWAMAHTTFFTMTETLKMASNATGSKSPKCISML